MSALERTIRVAALTRVEGEGGLYVRLRGKEVEEVRLEIYEPPRLFEALLRGRSLDDTIDIVARICGICPVAYQMSAAHAIERALGIVVSDEIRTLRRLLYCGEWIESHALHMHLLHAPDFLGYDSGFSMAADYREEIQRGLQLKKHGNTLLETLGGRAIHPINVAVGGFYRLPRHEELAALVPDFEWGLEAAIATTRWVAGFEFPDFPRDYDLVALVHPDEYPMNEGRITSSDGLQIDVSEFEQEFQERQVRHSTALHCDRRSTGRPYLVGPLARVGLNVEKLSPAARRLAGELAIHWPSTNPYHSIVARGLEVVHAFEEALSILRAGHSSKAARVNYESRSGIGEAATEAPRGLLYHRYEIDDTGHIVTAKIVPPTSQNQAQIEADLRALVSQIDVPDDNHLAVKCASLVRSYDPCISCSTHFLKLTVDRL